MPSLCSIETQRRSLRAAVGQDLRHQEQRDAPASPAARPGSPGEHEVDDIVGEVVLAVGDEDLLAGDPVAAVAGRLGPGLERADVRARLRLGEVHRPGPFAGDQLRQPGRLQLGRAVMPAAPRPRPASASCTSEKPMLAEPRSSITTVARTSGSPCPPCSGGPGQRAPAALDIGRDRLRGSPAAWSRPRATICAPTSSPIRFSGANSPAANAPAPSTIASTRSGVASAKRIVAGQLVDADDMAEQESLFVDGRRVGHAGPRTLRCWNGGYSAARVSAQNTRVLPYGPRGDRRGGAADRAPAGRSRCRPRPSTASPPTPPTARRSRASTRPRAGRASTR